MGFAEPWAWRSRVRVEMDMSFSFNFGPLGALTRAEACMVASHLARKALDVWPDHARLWMHAAADALEDIGNGLPPSIDCALNYKLHQEWQKDFKEDHAMSRLAFWLGRVEPRTDGKMLDLINSVIYTAEEAIKAAAIGMVHRGAVDYVETSRRIDSGVARELAKIGGGK